MNQQNSLRLIKIAALLVCTGGFAWFGFGFLSQRQTVEQWQKANDLLKQKQYKSAITVYDRLLETDIDVTPSHLIWIGRGYAFLGLNRYQDMLQSCSEATSIEPKFGLAWNCRGEALYYLEQKENALKAFEQATKISPQEGTFWLNQARVLSDLKQYKAAIKSSDRAIKSSDRSQAYNNSIAFDLKGRNLLNINQYQESLAAFESSLENAPDYLSAQQGKGIALYELGSFSKAISTFDEILQRDNLTMEQKAIALLYQGVSLCQMDKIIEAEKAFQTVLKLTTDSQSLKIAEKGCGIRNEE